MTKETKWSIDQDHSEISFKLRHLMIAHVRGNFKKFEASIQTVKNDFLTADIDLWIDVASIDTDNEKRDEHLRSTEFFDVANHKQITFLANTIEKSEGGDKHDLWGDLTIKGITKKVKMNIEFGGITKDPWGNEKAGFTVTGKINRTEFGLTWNNTLETGGIMVGEEVSILCEIELINTTAKNEVVELEA